MDEGKIAGVITMVARHGALVHFEAVGARGADDSRALDKDALFPYLFHVQAHYRGSCHAAV